MIKAFELFLWENEPSVNTPLGETLLNKVNVAVNEIDNRVLTLDSKKANQADLLTAIADVTFDETTGIITFTKKSGAQTKIDTKMEKLAVNFKYDTASQNLIITLEDGSKQYVDMRSLITELEFLDSDTVLFSVGVNGDVKAHIAKGSITAEMLDPDYRADIELYASQALSSATNAKEHADDSATAAKMAESYTHGKTGAREGEDTDNAKYYMEQAKAISGSGVSDLIDGTIPAAKATADADGNVISETYLKKDDVGTVLEDVEELITGLEDGTTTVGKAVADAEGNEITKTYSTKEEVEEILAGIESGETPMGNAAALGGETATQWQTKIDNIIDGTTPIAGAGDSKTLNGLTAEEFVNNDNLAINTNFLSPVNSRGVTSWTGKVATIDKWMIGTDNGSAELTEEGLKLTYSGTTGTTLFVQTLPQDLSYFAGKTCTMSAKADGKVTSLTFTFPNEFTSAIYDGPQVVIGNGQMQIDCIKPTDTNAMQFRVIGWVAESCTIEWMKLEIGAVATPYTPPNKEVEKLKCLGADVFKKYATETISTLPSPPTEQKSYRVHNGDSTFPYLYGVLDIQYGNLEGGVNWEATYKAMDGNIYYNKWSLNATTWNGWKNTADGGNANTLNGLTAGEFVRTSSANIADLNTFTELDKFVNVKSGTTSNMPPTNTTNFGKAVNIGYAAGVFTQFYIPNEQNGRIQKRNFISWESPQWKDWVDITDGFDADGTNLLVNPDFKNPVNSSGKTEWTATPNLTIVDKWGVGSSNSTVTLTDDGLVFTKTGESYTWFSQHISNLESLAGKTVALSFKVNGSIYKGTCLLPTDLPTATVDAGNVYFTGGYANLYKINTNNTLQIRFIIGGSIGDVFTIEWVKLELGKQATTFVPPNKEVEKLKCGIVDMVTHTATDLNAEFTNAMDFSACDYNGSTLYTPYSQGLTTASQGKCITCKYNQTNTYAIQMALPYGSTKIFVRKMDNGNIGNWENAKDGGNADTVDGYHASSLVKENVCGTTIVKKFVEVGINDNVVVHATLVLRKLSSTRADLHIAYKIISNTQTELLYFFISTDKVKTALGLTTLAQGADSFGFVTFKPIFDKSGDDLNITTAQNSPMYMGDTGCNATMIDHRIGIGRFYDSNGSQGNWSVTTPLFAVGTYGQIDFYGVSYS